MNFAIAVLLATVLVVLDAAPYNKRQYFPSQPGYYYPLGLSAYYVRDDYYSPYGSASAGYSGSPYYSGYNRRPTINNYRPSGYRYPGSLGYQSAAFPGVFGFP